MTSLPSKEPEKRDEISGTFLSLVTISFLELRQDLAKLIQSGWAEPPRRRAQELASTLEEACGRHRVPELARLARSIASLARLSPREACPVLVALRDKFDELLSLAQREIARYSKRQTG
jgi:hypothetical protein